MAHIRKQFKEQSSKKLDGYNRKKYVCKILYMYLLGYDLEFGYMEAVRLVSSNKFSEKQIVRLQHFPTPFPLHHMLIFPLSVCFRGISHCLWCCMRSTK
jgi:hypothetical protein